MDEARRFLRYVVPGLVYGAETLLLLFILVPWWTTGIVEKLGGDAGLGAVVAILLASGGLGFLFSTVHHALHWIPRLTSVDHRPLVQFLESTGAISIRPISTNPAQPAQRPASQDAVGRDDAWSIVTSLWYQRTTSCKAIEAADPRSVGLTDAMHSLGTGRVASVAAWMTALWLAASVGTFSIERWPSFLVANVMALLLLVILQTGYSRTGKLSQRFVSSVLADSLSTESDSGTKPRPIATHLEVPTLPLASGSPTKLSPAPSASRIESPPGARDTHDAV